MYPSYEHPKSQMTTSPARISVSSVSWCGSAEFAPAATIANDGTPPRRRISDSMTSATWRSVTPGRNAASIAGTAPSAMAAAFRIAASSSASLTDISRPSTSCPLRNSAAGRVVWRFKSTSDRISASTATTPLRRPQSAERTATKAKGSSPSRHGLTSEMPTRRAWFSESAGAISRDSPVERTANTSSLSPPDSVKPAR